MLVRSMSPDVVAVDELGREEDFRAVESVIHCGCRLIATAHGNSVEDILNQPFFQKLKKMEIFEKYIVLGDRKQIGIIKGIYDEKGQNAENGGKPVADPGWSRNRVCQKSGDHRKRKEPGDFASDSFFSERRDPMQATVLFQTHSGRLQQNQWIFWTILRDAAQEMEDTGGKNLEEIMGFCIQRNFYQGNPGGSQRKEEMEILRTLGRRLGYLDREMQIKQIELLETDVEEQRRQLREKMPEQKKICQSLGIMGGILLAVLFW